MKRLLALAALCSAITGSLWAHHSLAAEYDTKNEVLRPRPLHDSASHGADAFRYGVMGADDAPKLKDLPQVQTDWVV